VRWIEALHRRGFPFLRVGAKLGFCGPVLAVCGVGGWFLVVSVFLFFRCLFVVGWWCGRRSPVVVALVLVLAGVGGDWGLAGAARAPGRRPSGGWS